MTRSLNPRDWAATGSRVLDLVVAGIAIVVTSPLMLLIVIAILFESGRPVFFSQIRLGQYGRHFRMIKFRKFAKSCDATGLPLTMHQDKRLSRVGRVLVASKLDELPQLYNVFKKDMSLVGPRPESLAFADCFDGEYSALLGYRPGIFGPSQVSFRNECALYPTGVEPTRFYREVLFPLKAHFDLSYYPCRTLLSDCMWVARGVIAVVKLRRRLPDVTVGRKGFVYVDGHGYGGALREQGRS